MNTASTPPLPTTPEPVVAQGELICYRMLDLGDEVVIAEAEAALAGGESPRRLKLSRAASTLVFKAAPLDVTLPPREIALPDGNRVRAQVTARLFDIGIASVRFELPIPAGTPLGALTPLMAELYELETFAAEARQAIEELRPRLGGSIRGAPACVELEPYSVVFVREFAGAPKAREVLAHREVLAKLLLGETGSQPLARSELEAIERFAFSYFENDLVVVDWDGALVLEPSGTRDVIDVLEFATALMVGLRGYDALIDRELEHFYDHVQSASSNPLALLWSPYAGLAKRVQERWLEATEFTDRTENALKVVADLYLARVYRAALERGRVTEWQAAITKKQARIAQVYQFLKDEVDARRATVLEVSIVLLIVVEILLVPFK